MKEKACLAHIGAVESAEERARGTRLPGQGWSREKFEISVNLFFSSFQKEGIVVK